LGFYEEQKLKQQEHLALLLYK